MSRMIENRPWGTFEVLLETEYTKVKKISVLPNQRLSLQYHDYRSEVWTIVKGIGEFTDGENVRSVCAGNILEIQQGDKHRITAGDDGVTFIEVQLSSMGILDEEDIIRLEDDYNRSIIDEIRKNQGHPHE
jgi:mannose-6-phosphate isomerase-like protein (cupin superfamily)